MNVSTMSGEFTKFRIFETACPYNGYTVCKASFSSMKIDSYIRAKCCDTENFDNCPIFLAKVLRRF